MELKLQIRILSSALTDIAAGVGAQVVIEEDEGASAANLLKVAGEEVDSVSHCAVSPA